MQMKRTNYHIARIRPVKFSGRLKSVLVHPASKNVVSYIAGRAGSTSGAHSRAAQKECSSGSSLALGIAEVGDYARKPNAPPSAAMCLTSRNPRAIKLFHWCSALRCLLSRIKRRGLAVGCHARYCFPIEQIYDARGTFSAKRSAPIAAMNFRNEFPLDMARAIG